MKRHRKNPNRRNAFTLMEVLLVLAILGVIAAMVVPQLIGKQEDAMISATEASIKGIADGLKHYSTKHDGAFPDSGQDILRTLSRRQVDEDGKPDGPWIEKYVDAWGNKFNYDWNQSSRSNSKDQNMITPAIWSNGPDGVDNQGNGDDIRNWGKEEDNI
ncbi:MAG: type II secretion system protein GspG [Planctomycetes bacterium]|nr:type II secretion system protein GspG [Planctomycetota bacterium]